MVQYQITSDSEFQGAVVYLSGGLRSVSADHPSYQSIITGLISGALSEDELIDLINPAQGAGSKLQALSERVSYKNGTILFDGDVIDSAIADHIVKIIESGSKDEDYAPLALFLEKLSTNPSKESQEHLYHFVRANGMTITDEGDLLAYKGVNADGTSVHAGYGIVNGEEFENANLANDVGNVVEIPRSMVDDNRNEACSTGLHVGAYSYASTFNRGGRLLTVVVNPRDVVAVPNDSHDQKVRVCRYTVHAISDEKIETPTYRVTNCFSDSDDEFDGDDEYYEEDQYSISDGATEDYIEGQPEDKPEEIEGTPEEQYFLRKVAEFTKSIPGLVKEGKALRRHRSKNITAKARPAFDKAVEDLGLTYE